VYQVWCFFAQVVFLVRVRTNCRQTDRQTYVSEVLNAISTPAAMPATARVCCVSLWSLEPAKGHGNFFISCARGSIQWALWANKIASRDNETQAKFFACPFAGSVVEWWTERTEYSTDLCFIPAPETLYLNSAWRLADTIKFCLWFTSRIVNNYSWFT